MSITTYTELQTAIGSWLHRTDLSTQIPDFIMLAEQRMNADFKSRNMEARVTLTCTPGSTLSARLVALPTDMVEMRRLAVVDTDPAVVLEYKSPDQLVADNSYLISASKPNSFTVIGPNIELSPPPDAAYPLELIYQQKIPPLSNTNPTNWVLINYPNAYLFGALMVGTQFAQDNDRLPLYEKKYLEAKETINSIDWYSGSNMRVRAR